jgi:signal transduction histidine kinase
MAKAAVVDVHTLPAGQLSLPGYFDLLEDADCSLDLDDVLRAETQARFRGGDVPAEALQLGYTRSAWWLRLTLKNAGDEPVSRVIELANSRLTRIRFYRPEADGGHAVVTTGSLAPFASRPYPNRYFVFPVTLPPRTEAVYFFRIESSSALLLPATLWEPDAFRAHERADYVAQAWYVGMAMAMALFNLLLYFALRDVLYLLYVALISTIAFTILSHNGIVKEFIPFDSPWWSQSSASMGYALSIALLMLFMRHMLRIKAVLPGIDRLLQVLMWLNLLPIPAALLLAHQFAIYPIQFISLATMVVAIGTGVYLSYRRQRSAYFFSIAYLLLFAVAALHLLTALGALPLLLDVGWSYQVGSAAEMLLLAFALADRFNQLRLDKEKAQYDVAVAQARLVETLRTSEQTLERRVAQRAAELRQFIDMLGHELKTPMSVIRLCLGMENPAPAAKQHAQQCVQDIDAIIERCVQADRLDHGEPPLRRQPCRIDVMLDALISAGSGAERIVLTGEVAEPIETDAQLLHLVLSNLIDNALKYAAPEDPIQIGLQEIRTPAGSGISLRIANVPGSAGMPDAGQVFEKYYRSPGAHGKSGSGLGLYLVQRIVTLLGGTIDYRPTASEVIFELWIPH